MRKFSIPLLLLLLISSISIKGQQVRISGSGPGYGNAELRFYRQSDPVTKKRIPVTRIIADNDGRFETTVPVNEKEMLFIDAGIYSFYLYAEAGKCYDLKLPELIRKTSEEEQNLYFIPVRIIPEVINIPGDINNRIRSFDLVFDPLFNRIANRVAYNVRRDEIPEMIEKLNSLVSQGEDEFMSDFATFRLIMLNMVALGEYPGRIEDSILVNRKFRYDNPAYLDLIDQMFGRYFSDLSGGKNRNSFMAAVNSASFGKLRSVIAADGRVSDSDLCDYIILLNLYPSYFDRSVEASIVLSLVDSVRSSSLSEYIRRVASAVNDELTSLSIGRPAPQFTLNDKSGKQVSLHDLKDKYLLLSFGRSDNMNTIAEYGMMKAWEGKYRGKLTVVTILRDSDFRKALTRMEGYGFTWMFLDGSSADLLEYLYGVYSYPSFILIDPSGSVYRRNSPHPSENLEQLIGRLGY